MTIENGDMPAHPLVNNGHILDTDESGHLEDKAVCTGLTKREHFAVMAMQGMLSGNMVSDIHNGMSSYIAEASILCADALLAELDSKS